MDKMDETALIMTKGLHVEGLKITTRKEGDRLWVIYHLPDDGRVLEAQFDIEKAEWFVTELLKCAMQAAESHPMVAKIPFHKNVLQLEAAVRKAITQ